jgi:phosphohistidine phosphatase
VRHIPKWFYAQSAVIPYRRVGDSLEVLLITSRRGKRWTLPKGVIEPSMTPAASAAKEAFEEAGVLGDVGRVCLGAFEYAKWGGTCHVEVYPLDVREVLDTWPEAHQRQRRWLAIDVAVDEIGIDGLRPMLRALTELMRDQDSSAT